MAVASNDQGRIYFNGVDIYVWSDPRGLVLDSEKGRVTLKQGINVIIFKIINEQGNWQGAMRLLDKGGASFERYQNQTVALGRKGVSGPRLRRLLISSRARWDALEPWDQYPQ